MIDWSVTASEARTIQKIADRAVQLAKEHGIDVSRIDVQMDITAAHKNGCPLKLQELLDAPEPDFVHDVFEIRRHIDRRTGQLGGCLLPRYAA